MNLLYQPKLAAIRISVLTLTCSTTFHNSLWHDPVMQIKFDVVLTSKVYCDLTLQWPTNWLWHAHNSFHGMCLVKIDSDMSPMQPDRLAATVFIANTCSSIPYWVKQQVTQILTVKSCKHLPGAQHIIASQRLSFRSIGSVSNRMSRGILFSLSFLWFTRSSNEAPDCISFFFPDLLQQDVVSMFIFPTPLPTHLIRRGSSERSVGNWIPKTNKLF